MYTEETATPWEEEHRPGPHDTRTLPWIFKEIFPGALEWDFAL